MITELNIYNCEVNMLYLPLDKTSIRLRFIEHVRQINVRIDGNGKATVSYQWNNSDETIYTFEYLILSILVTKQDVMFVWQHKD